MIAHESDLSNCTSNLGIVGHAHTTDPVVGHCCHFTCTSSSVPVEQEERESEMFKETTYLCAIK